MASSYYIINKVDSQTAMQIKLFDNGDGTYSETERRAVDLGAPITGVNAGVRNYWPTTRGGIPFVIGGHPDILTKNLQITAADAGQVGTAIIPGVMGRSIVVTKLSVNTAKEIVEIYQFVSVLVWLILLIQTLFKFFFISLLWMPQNM